MCPVKYIKVVCNYLSRDLHNQRRGLDIALVIAVWSSVPFFKNLSDIQDVYASVDRCELMVFLIG